MVEHEQKFVQIALFSRGMSFVLKGKILANISHFLLIRVLGLTIRILQSSTDLVDTDLIENFDSIDNLKKIAATNLWFFSPAKARFSRKFCGDQFLY